MPRMKKFLQQVAVVILAMTLLDLVYALYVIATARESAVLAGVLASAIIALSAVVTRAYVNDKRMVPAAMVGAFVGTYVAVAYFP